MLRRVVARHKLSVVAPIIRCVSLTSVLNEDDHPFARWLRTHLRRTAAVRASYASTFPVRRVQRPVAAGRTVVRWDLLGVAADFRLRSAFVIPQPPPSVVAGVDLAGAMGGSAVQRVGEALLDAYMWNLDAFGPYRRGRPWPLNGEAETQLDRMCFALAWFDRVFRDGVLDPGSPLAAPDGGGTLEALLARVPE